VASRHRRASRRHPRVSEKETAGHVGVRPGAVRPGETRHGWTWQVFHVERSGDWQPPGFEALAPTAAYQRLRGSAMPGSTSHGLARLR
jgi:hypothetical protein